MSTQTFRQQPEFQQMVERLSDSRLAWVNMPNFVTKHPRK